MIKKRDIQDYFLSIGVNPSSELSAEDLAELVNYFLGKYDE